MNESDDYNFDSVDNSNLSSLFGKEALFAKGNSSLIYKAPKQPTNAEYKATKALATKFFYKYIILYEIIAENEDELGKYIIGIMTSENGSEILIYQNKRNILVRGDINTCTFSKCSKNFSLFLPIGGQKWLLQFMNKEDYTEFVAEVSKLGGRIAFKYDATDQPKIKKFESQETSHLHLNFNYSEPDSSILVQAQTQNGSSKVASLDNSNSEDIESKKEKEEILARLAKIGLPLLPSFQIESKNNTSDDLVDETNAVEIKNNMTKENISASTSSNMTVEQRIPKNNQQIVNAQKDIAPITSKGNTYDSQENYFNGQTANRIQTLNTSIQIDPISLILAENRIINTELNQYMSLLNCKLDSIANLKESNVPGAQDRLKSKIKALQIKSENLEDELNRCLHRCDKVDRINLELSSRLEEIQKLEDETTCTNKETKSSQTDLIEKKFDGENDGYKSQLTDLLKFIECLPLKSVEFSSTKLKTMKDEVLDEQLVSNYDTCINFLEEHVRSQNSDMDNIEEMRKNFIRTTKKIMFDMYSALNSSVGEDSDFKILLTEQVRNVTAQLVQNFDKSIQNKY